MTVRRIFPNINKKKIRDRFCLPFRAVLCTKSIGKGTLDYSNMCKCSRENYKNIFQPQGKFNSKRNLNSPSDQKNRAVFRSRKTKRKESPPVSCCYPTNYIFHSSFFGGGVTRRQTEIYLGAQLSPGENWILPISSKKSAIIFEVIRLDAMLTRSVALGAGFW